MNVKVYKDSRLIAENIHVAKSFLTRLVGLLGKKTLEPGEGLLLMPCRQIHTWFMSIDIDVVFLDTNGQIMASIAGMKPGLASPRVKNCCRVLEMAAGSIARHDLLIGTVLEIRESNLLQRFTI